MGTVAGMLAEARKSLGTTEHPPGSNHNYITEWYNDNIDQIGDGAWCDMSVTMWAAKSGNGAAVGEFAYTVWHAQWFKERGQWHSGAGGIRPGDIVFYDWGQSRDIGRIDHVGVVEEVEGGRIVTIEGNSGDVCKRQVRDDTYIVGYGRPSYDPGKISAPSGKPVLRRGATGSRVTRLQQALNKALGTKLDTDGDFGPLTEKAVRNLQKKAKIAVDGEYGPDSAKALAKLL